MVRRSPFFVSSVCSRCAREQPSRNVPHPTWSAVRWIKSDAAKVKDDPIPFLNNNARNFKIDGVYKVDSRSLKRQRFAFPLGLGLFGVIMFLGFYGKDYEKYVRMWSSETIDPIHLGEGHDQTAQEHVDQFVPNGNEKH